MVYFNITNLNEFSAMVYFNAGEKIEGKVTS